jgi:arginyl-tRNA synthetase
MSTTTDRKRLFSVCCGFKRFIATQKLNGYKEVILGVLSLSRFCYNKVSLFFIKPHRNAIFIMMTIKHLVEIALLESLKQAKPLLGDAVAPLPEADWIALFDKQIKVEVPKNLEHGDYAVNVSFLARYTKLAPPVIAQTVAQVLNQHSAYNATFTWHPIAGFVNAKVTEKALLEALNPLLLGKSKAGENTSKTTERILLEFVSANPTGPLHLGHGRWAALGDSLRRILEHCGASVCAEFYINDHGQQMSNMANSLWFRCLEQLGLAAFPTPEADVPFPYYPGDYVKTLAEQYLSAPQQKAELEGWFHQYGAVRVEMFDTQTPFLTLRTYSRDAMLALQRGLLDALHVRFDSWQFETDLHAEGKVEEALASLKASGHTYEQEGALWLKSSELGDEKDRVLVKSSGAYTYLAADVANHDKKFKREAIFAKPAGKLFGSEQILGMSNAEPQVYAMVHEDSLIAPSIILPKVENNANDNVKRSTFSRSADARNGEVSSRFNRVMHIWGADHHGYIPRMKAAIAALGHNADNFQVILGQLVNLVVNGEKTRMGKRKTMLTLHDVVEEVGVDATRFWLVARSADSTIEFDLDLAASASEENPVFYTQYAHARCSGILRQATEPSINRESGETVQPRFSKQQLDDVFQTYTAEGWNSLLFDPLVSADNKAFIAVREIVLALVQFPEKVADAGRVLSPHLIVRYAMDLASQFHSFYNACRVLCEDEQQALARLALVRCIQLTLAQALDLLGVSAPEKM